ncbi:MAG: hypothetical protein PVF26_15410 [Desulfobacterales bacterium]|jgi:hypothetical protein
MKGWLFKTIDVEKFEKEHSLFKKSKLLPCAPGTKWKDIKITLIDNETVRIKTPEGEGLFTYHKLNLDDSRIGNKPSMLWELLKILAKNYGLISSRNIAYDTKLSDTARRLIKHLSQLFGIPDSIYLGHYKKYKGYN